MKEKAYIIFEKSFKEIEECVKDMPDYGDSIYKCELDTSHFTEEQRKIQTKNSWYTCQHGEVYMTKDTLEKLARDSIHTAISGGSREDIVSRALETALNTKYRITGTIVDRRLAFPSFFAPNSTFSSVPKRLQLNTEIGEEHNDNCEYSTDVKEFEELLKECGKEVPVSNDAIATQYGTVWLERLEINLYKHRFISFGTKVGNAINKILRNEFKYCFKNSKLIVPEEYLAKGAEGIKEWQDIKRSNNKNNSIEKKMLRDIIKEKKEYADDCVSQVMRRIDNLSSDWSIPKLTIDGRWNKQRNAKLVTKILGTKEKQKIIEMTKEEIAEKAKEYWKQRLMEAYNAIDK